MSPMISRASWAAAMAGLCALAFAPIGGAASPPPPEFGVDRSNMGTQWTLAPPQEPNVAPFLAAALVLALFPETSGRPLEEIAPEH